MLNILQARLQHYMNQNFQMSKMGFKKKNQRSNCQHLLDHRESKGKSRKTSTFVSWTVLKPLTVWTITNCGKLLKRWEHQTILPVSWETCMWVKKQQLEPCLNNWLVQDWERSTTRLFVSLMCRPRHTQCWTGWVTIWNQDCLEKYWPQICRWYHSNGRKVKRTTEPLDEGEAEEWKRRLKTQCQEKTKITASSPIAGKGKRWKHWRRPSSWALKSLWMVTAAEKLEASCFPAGKQRQAWTGW